LKILLQIRIVTVYFIVLQTGISDASCLPSLLPVSTYTYTAFQSYLSVQSNAASQSNLDCGQHYGGDLWLITQVILSLNLGSASLTNPMTLSKFSKHFQPQFLHLKVGITNSTNFMELMLTEK
jgi:hypothetical protein